MVDILCGGFQVRDVMLVFNSLKEIMWDDMIGSDALIEFSFSDGTRGAIRKRAIDGFYESDEENDGQEGD